LSSDDGEASRSVPAQNAEPAPTSTNARISSCRMSAQPRTPGPEQDVEDVAQEEERHPTRRHAACGGGQRPLCRSAGPGSGPASRRCRRAWRPRASAPRRGRTRRAEAAAERLRHTTDPSSRIGRDAGRPDQNHVARRFKAHLGMSSESVR
jgi:hypothetical protein